MTKIPNFDNLESVVTELIADGVVGASADGKVVCFLEPFLLEVNITSVDFGNYRQA